MDSSFSRRTQAGIATVVAGVGLAGFALSAGSAAPKGVASTAVPGPAGARGQATPATRPEPLSPAAAAAQSIRADVESLDAEIQAGLDQMGRYLKEFEAERRTWVALDMTVDAARRVNASLLSRNRTVLSLYDSRLSAPLERFEERLREAPAVYRRLAEERRKSAKEATLDAERKSYELMATLCDSAARLCEQRHREVFGGESGQPNALTLAETLANMRKYEIVHVRWEDTFARYPSSLDDRRMAALFAHLSVYAEDLQAFTQGVEALTGAMRRKAADDPGRRSNPDGSPGSEPAPPRPDPDRPASGSDASLASAATQPAATPPDGRPIDILQPGAVLEGSLLLESWKFPCKLIVVERTTKEFVGRMYVMHPERTAELDARGTIDGKYVTMKVDVLPVSGTSGSARINAWLDGEKLTGQDVRPTGPTYSFALTHPGVSSDQLAAARPR